MQLEFRKAYRKEVRLEGFAKGLVEGSRWGNAMSQNLPYETKLESVNCIIKNISTKGMGLEALGKPKIKEGDHITVEFILDTSTSPRMKKRAMVRVINGNYIGCEFIESDKDDKDLGFYVI